MFARENTVRDKCEFYINQLNSYAKSILLDEKKLHALFMSLLNDAELIPRQTLFVLLKTKNIAAIWPELDDALIANLLNWLLSQLDVHAIPPNTVLTLLQMNDIYASNLGHDVMLNKGREAASLYIDLLETLLNEKVDANKIIDLLKKQRVFSFEGYTIGHCLADICYTDINIRYIHLLNRLATLVNRESIQSLIAIEAESDYITDEHRLNYVNMVAIARSDELKFHLLNSNLLSDKQIQTFSEYPGNTKEALLDHLLTLEKEEQIKALRNAVDAQHTLNKFFFANRGDLYAHADRFIIEKISKTLDGLVDSKMTLMKR